ncbi:5385_t:CDS:2, partial [Gigaspora rosea]
INLDLRSLGGNLDNSHEAPTISKRIVYLLDKVTQENCDNYRNDLDSFEENILYATKRNNPYKKPSKTTNCEQKNKKPHRTNLHQDTISLSHISRIFKSIQLLNLTAELDPEEWLQDLKE